MSISLFLVHGGSFVLLPLLLAMPAVHEGLWYALLLLVCSFLVFHLVVRYTISYSSFHGFDSVLLG